MRVAVALVVAAAAVAVPAGGVSAVQLRAQGGLQGGLQAGLHEPRGTHGAQLHHTAVGWVGPEHYGRSQADGFLYVAPELVQLQQHSPSSGSERLQVLLETLGSASEESTLAESGGEGGAFVAPATVPSDGAVEFSGKAGEGGGAAETSSGVSVTGDAAKTVCIPGSRIDVERCPTSGMRCPLTGGVCCVLNPHYCCPANTSCVTIVGDEDAPVTCVATGNSCKTDCQTKGTRTLYVSPVCGQVGAGKYPEGTVTASATSTAAANSGSLQPLPAPSMPSPTTGAPKMPENGNNVPFMGQPQAVAAASEGGAPAATDGAASIAPKNAEESAESTAATAAAPEMFSGEESGTVFESGAVQSAGNTLPSGTDPAPDKEGSAPADATGTAETSTSTIPENSAPAGTTGTTGTTTN